MAALVICAFALIVSACTSSDDDQPTANTTASPATTTPEPQSAYDRVLAQIATDGDVTQTTALQAFSLAFGDLPGVTLPDGPREPVVFGGGPLRWIERFWGDLSADQRDAAVSALGFDPTSLPGASDSSPSNRLVHRIGTADPKCDAEGWADPAGVESYRRILDDALATLGTVVGPLPGRTTIRVCALARPGDEGAWAAAHGVWGEGYLGCVMYVYPKLADTPPDEAVAIITHEAWHCYQSSTAASATEHMQRPPWVIEGGAMWVGEAFGGGPTANPRTAAYWKAWMSTPRSSLFGRSFDALGFWATVADASSAEDTLGIMLRTSRASGDDDAFYGAAVSGLASEVEYRWASRYFRYTERSTWDTVGRGVAPASRAPAPVIDTAAPGIDVVAPPRAAAQTYLDATSDLVIVTVDGPARFGDASGVDEVIAERFTGCTRAGGCACPAGSTAPGPSTAVVAPLRLAVTGTGRETTAHTEAISLEDWCRRSTTTSSPPTSASTELSVCDLFTLEDARLLTPDVTTSAFTEMTPGSGSCLYTSEAGASLTGAFILQRPTPELAAGDYPMVTACTQDLPGVGDRAGTGIGPDGEPIGCLLQGRTVVMISTNGNASAMPDVLERLADRL